MSKLRVGYVPNSQDLSAPGDRRRVVFWANSRGHQIVTDLSQQIDIIVLSERSNFTEFSKVMEVPIVLDLVDGYLARESLLKDWLRGTLKVVDQQLSGFPKPYTSFVKEICASASAVICSSEEQKLMIEKYSKNVHSILDSHSEIPLVQFANISKNDVKSILWEGLPVTLGGVLGISEVLLNEFHENNTQINFVTDEKYFRFLGKYMTHSTLSLLSSRLSVMVNERSVIPWTVDNLTNYAKLSSVAILPVLLSNPIQYLKPENRLLIMWRLGLPALTSNTPSYGRLSRETGLDFICENDLEWQQKIDRVLKDRRYAAEMVSVGQDYLDKNHSNEQLLKKWDAAIDSVL